MVNFGGAYTLAAIRVNPGTVFMTVGLGGSFFFCSVFVGCLRLKL